MNDGLRNWWVSWYARGAWTLYWPWWISGETMDDEVILCAAVRAASEDEAWEIVRSSHDEPSMFRRERFLEERPDDWTPYRGRFPKYDWMKWPEAAPPSALAEQMADDPTVPPVYEPAMGTGMYFTPAEILALAGATDDDEVTP